MKKRILALVLLTSMVLSACGGSNGSSNETKQSNAAESKDAGSSDTKASVDDGESTAAGTDSNEPLAWVNWDEDPYTIHMVYVGVSDWRDLEKVEAAINELALKEINMKVELTMTTYANMKQDVQLMMTGGEAVDIIPVAATDATGFMDGDFMLDLNDYIDQYGYNIKSYWGDNAKAANIDGFVYGIPTLKELVTPFGFCVREDILDELGIDINDYTGKGLEAFTEVLAKVKEAYPNMDIINNMNPARTPYTVDSLGDNLGVLGNYGQDTTITNFYESEEFLSICKTAREWYEAGYIMKDAATNTMGGAQMVKAGSLFGYSQYCNPKAQYIQTGATGYKMVVLEVYPTCLMCTASVASQMNCIAYNSKDPEKAFRFLDWAIGSKEFNTLLMYGIEGEHYVLDDVGNAVYPEGVDANNVGYHRDLGFLTPNQFVAEIWDGLPLDIWETFDEFNADSIKSKAFGFTFDASGVATEIAALNNVISEYEKTLLNGMVDPEPVIKEFNDKLYKNGLDKVIEEKQKQFDEWLQNQ